MKVIFIKKNTRTHIFSYKNTHLFNEANLYGSVSNIPKIFAIFLGYFVGIPWVFRDFIEDFNE